jgi:shikimate kinase
MAVHSKTTMVPNKSGIVYLVGMPCAGKSYWGAKLAKAHKFTFIDLDKHIEQKEGKTIEAIFAQDGEEAFRSLEHKYVKETLAASEPCTIIATGGGTPCFSGNMDLMKQSGTVVYLQAHPYYLYRNLLRSGESRPLLTGDGDAIDLLQDLLNKRKSCYEQAHIILQAKDISLTTFDKIIASCIDRH